MVSVSGCGDKTPVTTPTRADQRTVAARFATALLHGDTPRARDLLVPEDDGSRLFLVRQATASWRRTQRVSIQRPNHTGRTWTFRYVRRRTQRDGRFQTQRGRLVVIIASSPAGARVEFFSFRDVRTRYSTHHDGQLLPSNR